MGVLPCPQCSAIHYGGGRFLRLIARPLRAHLSSQMHTKKECILQTDVSLTISQPVHTEAPQTDGVSEVYKKQLNRLQQMFGRGPGQTHHKLTSND